MLAGVEPLQEHRKEGMAETQEVQVVSVLPDTAVPELGGLEHFLVVGLVTQAYTSVSESMYPDLLTEACGAPELGSCYEDKNLPRFLCHQRLAV